MSRKQAKNTFRWASVRQELKDKGVTVLSAGIDENPHVYKDIRHVMARQRDLVAVAARFDPKLVKMVPDGERAEEYPPPSPRWGEGAGRVASAADEGPWRSRAAAGFFVPLTRLRDSAALTCGQVSGTVPSPGLPSADHTLPGETVADSTPLDMLPA